MTGAVNVPKHYDEKLYCVTPCTLFKSHAKAKINAVW